MNELLPLRVCCARHKFRAYQNFTAQPLNSPERMLNYGQYLVYCHVIDEIDAKLKV